jgi:hypothetical protein
MKKKRRWMDERRVYLVRKEEEIDRYSVPVRVRVK